MSIDGRARADFSLDGRVALVTGSSTGLGRVMAHALGAAGARVALNYANDRERAERAFAEYREGGGDGVLIRASAIDEAEIDAQYAPATPDAGSTATL